MRCRLARFRGAAWRRRQGPGRTTYEAGAQQAKRGEEADKAKPSPGVETVDAEQAFRPPRGQESYKHERSRASHHALARDPSCWRDRPSGGRCPSFARVRLSRSSAAPGTVEEVATVRAEIGLGLVKLAARRTIRRSSPQLFQYSPARAQGLEQDP